MIREGVAADLPAITDVRTAVRENHLSVEQMADLGITPQSVAARMASGDLGCWVVEEEGCIVGFSMADRIEGEVFALFVHPLHERKGYGSALLDACEVWLRQQGHEFARLNTDAGTRAFSFYERKCWRPDGRKAGLPGDEQLTKRLR